MTSLSEIRSFNPCLTGWNRIYRTKKHLGPDTQFPLIDCCDSNTFADVCWLLGKRKVEIGIVVNAAKKCADSVADLKSPDCKGRFADAAADADASATYAATYAYDAAATAAEAAAYAAEAAAAAYAYDAAADAAVDAAYAAAYAAADAAPYADDVYHNQTYENLQFLREAILEWEATH
jgi:tryptophan 2,3-dioxygenase